MPVYESIKNADNKIVISAQNKDSVIFGWQKTISALADKVANGAKVVAIDGWYGIDYEKIATALAGAITGKKVTKIPAEDLFISREEIIEYNKVAKKVCLENNVVINDLFALCENWGAEMFKDYTHFTDSANQQLANQVSEEIKKLF